MSAVRPIDLLLRESLPAFDPSLLAVILRSDEGHAVQPDTSGWSCCSSRIGRYCTATRQWPRHNHLLGAARACGSPGFGVSSMRLRRSSHSPITNTRSVATSPRASRRVAVLRRAERGTDRCSARRITPNGHPGLETRSRVAVARAEKCLATDGHVPRKSAVKSPSS